MTDFSAALQDFAPQQGPPVPIAGALQPQPAPDAPTGFAAAMADLAGLSPKRPALEFTMAEPGKEVSPGPAASMGRSVIDNLLAGAQGVSPFVTPGQAQLAPASEQVLGTDNPQFDQQKYVALRDPGTGKMALYLRKPEMAETPLLPIGRMLGLAVPEGGIPSVARAPIPTASQGLLQDFATSGVTPSIPAVGQGIASRLATNIMSKLPIVGGPVGASARQSMADTGAAAERLASGYGTAANAEEAGGALQTGIPQFAQAVKTKAGQLYKAFEGTLDPASPIPIDNTLEALKGPLERFPTAPQLGAQITNPRLQTFFNTLAPSEKTIPAVFSSVIDASGNPILMQAAQKVQQGGTLTFGELSELRSTIGRMLGEPALVNDIPRADLKSVYGGISQDLGNAANAAGPEAAQAFSRANQFYKASMARIDQLEPLLSGSPEQSFAAINRAAGTGPAANAGLLRETQRSLTPEQWGDVGAAVIRRLGEPTAGTKDMLHGAEGGFSASSFATNWNKLSPAARDTLFGASSPGSNREALDALVRVADAQKQVMKFANPSGTASHMMGAGAAGLIAEHFFDLTHHPIATTLGLLGSYGASKALMAPGFARWLYGVSTSGATHPGAAGIGNALAQLDQASQLNPGLAPYAAQLRARLGQPSQLGAAAP